MLLKRSNGLYWNEEGMRRLVLVVSVFICPFFFSLFLFTHSNHLENSLALKEMVWGWDWRKNMKKSIVFVYIGRMGNVPNHPWRFGWQITEYNLFLSLLLYCFLFIFVSFSMCFHVYSGIGSYWPCYVLYSMNNLMFFNVVIRSYGKN